MNGKLISLSRYEPGGAVPHVWPNGGGATALALDPEYAGERIVRDEGGATYPEPENGTGPQRKKDFRDGDSKAGLMKAVADATMTAGAVNPLSSRADKHAKLYYEEVRHMTSDVPKIAKTTGYSEAHIRTSEVLP